MPSWRPEQNGYTLDPATGTYVGNDGRPLDPSLIGTIVSGGGAGGVLGGLSGAADSLDPANPHQTKQAAYEKAARDAKELADLQWQRQMQGLQGALGHVGNSQSLWNSIYGASPGGGAPGGGVPGTSTSAAPMTRPGPNGGTTYPDYITRPPNRNPDFQSILDGLNAAGGPQGMPTTQSVFSKPDPTTGRPTYQMPSPATSNPMVSRQPPAGGGVSQSSSALTAPASSAPVRPIGLPSASQGLDAYLGQPLPTSSIGSPSGSSFVAPSPPPPPMQAAGALPGLADFLGPQMGGGAPMSPLLRKTGWGGF